MTDRPIIFSAPMVRALLEGRKTQTRRLIKEWRYGEPRLPYRPGDRLYVREAHALVPSSAYRMSPGVPYTVNDEDGSQACVYREGWERSKPGTGWRPSIHMPRWASRLTLSVTEVRVQRLQEITEEDAWAEGCKPGELNDRGEPFPAEERHPKGGTTGWDSARDWYADLWNSLHGPDAWDANPWVVAVSFTVDRRNIDSLSPNP
jgi:hypothetical protein